MRGTSVLALLVVGAGSGYFLHAMVEADRARPVAPFTAVPDAREAASLPVPAASDTGTPAPRRTFAQRLGTLAEGNEPSQRVGAIAPPAAAFSADGLPDAEPVLVSEARQVGRRRAGNSPDRAALVRNLQSELRRVGCYAGEVTGEWTPPTKRAMKSFVDWVNARLSVDEPDHILLTLVQGQTARACGAGCPSGEALSADGRCVPEAINAKAPAVGAAAAAVAATSAIRRPSPAPRAPLETATIPAPVVEPVVPGVMRRPGASFDGRMTVGGPVPEARPGSATGALPAPGLSPALPGGGVPSTAALGAGADTSLAPGEALGPSPRPRPTAGKSGSQYSGSDSRPARRSSTLNDPRVARQLFFGPGAN